MIRTARSLTFLFKAPFLVAFLFFINLMTSPGHWWVQWAALGLGIAWRPTVRLALAASIAWSLAVWWLGEGLGGILAGTASPVNGAPGPVLFYAILARAGTNVVLVTVLVPAVAVGVGAALLGEPVEAGQLGGMALIALALAVVDGRLWARLSQRRAAASAGG